MNKYSRVNVLPCMLMLCVWGTAFGQYPAQGHGRVSMQGSIIDTPCAIATADRDQTINMDESTVGEIIRNGRGPESKFSLELVNCTLPSSSAEKESNRFRTTFDGPAEGNIFSVVGAAGIGLQIIDAAGNIAIPGQALPEHLLTAGSQHLEYTLRLVGNGHQLKAGDYYTVLRFKIDYF
ncbi:MAG: fimbrial protein [Silvania sp.]